MDPRNLSDLQLDALRELASIGAGHATTALSQMLGKAVELQVPSFDLVPVTAVPSALGGPEHLAGVVYCPLLGDIGGGIVFIAERDALLSLADLLRSRPPGTTRSLHAEEEALVIHAASVLISAYVVAIGRMADMNVLPGPPAFAFDMLGAIMEAVTLQVGMAADTTLLIMTRFQEEDAVVDAGLFYLPDPDSLEVLLGRLGMV